MGDAFFNGLLLVLSWPTFGLMLIGIAVGFVVGILPGIGGIATLAIMIPFTFGMNPAAAFAFLLGMHSVVATTGDLTSILFGIPGEGTSSATIVDGYPMTKQGQAGRAMGAALMSSLVGATVGVAVLALAVPIVRPLVLAFGSPEFFMMTIIGISFIGIMSGQSPLKGLLSGGLGLLMATIGIDGHSGVFRYTFSIVYLWDGIPIVPAVIGLFAVPEIIDLARMEVLSEKADVGKIGGVMEGIKDTFRHWWLVIRCSLIGTFLGLIPGMGGGTAAWIAYGHAVQTSPDKSRFGKGAIEGVLAPGAANNSKEGGALVPTIAFGVPGGPAMAVLLGAFLITGLRPGPDMLTKHLNVTFSMIWTVVISNIITVLASLPILKYLAKIASVRSALLTPIILYLAFLGAFTNSNSIGDLIMMLIFGALGYGMVTYGWPRAPMILALVLGRISENYFVSASGRYGAAWLLKPSILALFCIVLFNAIYPVIQERRKRKKAI